MATIYVRNENASPQDRHTTFTVPSSLAATLGTYAELSNGATAVLAEDDGNTALYAVRAAWPNDATGATAITATALGTNPGWYFNYHEAYGSSDCGTQVTFDPRALPRVTLILPGGARVNVLRADWTTMEPTIAIDSPRMRRLVWESHERGHHVWYALDLFHEDAVAIPQVAYCWSDEQNPSWSTPATHLEIAFGHEILPWWQAEHGWVFSNSNKTVTLPFDFTSCPSSGREWSTWSNTAWHGSRICLWAWMFGRPASGTIAADETVFDRCDFLEGRLSAAGWAGLYMVAGKVPPVPANPTYVIRPYQADSYPHYVTADHGYGASDEYGSQGLATSRNNNATGLKGAQGLISGGQAIHGYQPIYDFIAGSIRHALEPVYINRNGAWTVYGDYNYHFSLRHSYPYIAGQNRNWGAKSGTSWALPHSSSDNNGIYDQHHTLSTPTAAYALSHNYLVGLILEHEIRRFSLNDRRNLTQGAGVSGTREPGRLLVAALAARWCKPDLANLVDELVMATRGGYYWEWKRSMRLNQTVPPFIPIMSIRTDQITPCVGPDGLTWSSYREIWEAKGLIGLWHVWLTYDLVDARDLFYRLAQSFMDFMPMVVAATGTVTDLPAGYNVPAYIRMGPNQENGAAMPIAYRTEPGTWFLGNTGAANESIAHDYGLALSRWFCCATKLIANVHPSPSTRSLAQDMYEKLLVGGLPNGWQNSSQEATTGY